MKKSRLAVLALPLILSITILSITSFSMAALARAAIRSDQPTGALDQKSLERIYKEEGRFERRFLLLIVFQLMKGAA